MLAMMISNMMLTHAFISGFPPSISRSNFGVTKDSSRQLGSIPHECSVRILPWCNREISGKVFKLKFNRSGDDLQRGLPINPEQKFKALILQFWGIAIKFNVIATLSLIGIGWGKPFSSLVNAQQYEIADSAESKGRLATRDDGSFCLSCKQSVSRPKEGGLSHLRRINVASVPVAADAPLWNGRFAPF